MIGHMNQRVTKMHSSCEAQFHAQTRKKRQNQLIQEITSSQTQTFYRPTVVLAQIDDTIFAEMIIWHWPETTRYITSCNLQKKKRKKR